MGPAETHLEHGLVKLYWDGVEHELPGLLHLFHREETPAVTVDDGEMASEDGTAEMGLTMIVEDVERAGSHSTPPQAGDEDAIALRNRARTLLRASEWLDIEKVVEDREHATVLQKAQGATNVSNPTRYEKRAKKRASAGRRLFERMKRVRYSVIRSTYGRGKSPYAAMHMALRIGTVMFENGVAHTDGGVVISSRLSPHPDQASLHNSDNTRALLLTGKKRKLVFNQSRNQSQQWNKTTMKQVSGNDFCGLFDAKNENKVIDAFIQESLNVKGTCTGNGCSCEREKIYAGTIRVLNELKRYLGPRVRLYMNTVAGRLLDPSVRLAWHPDNNNCQAFCESLIDSAIFRLSFTSSEPISFGGGENAALNPFVDNSDRLKEVTRDSRLDTFGGLAEFLSTIDPESRRGSEAMDQLTQAKTKNLSIHLHRPSRTRNKNSIHELVQ
ncbi:unnamed protein product [Clonostachys solani]|uniref:Uncharacterized protein n=1 Tax=Clonostachys solani TaxID=160281 RepID=A0A9N9Z7Y3_9HYPO|nr:unnamed protein product [Clonostachys solani]